MEVERSQLEASVSKIGIKPYLKYKLKIATKTEGVV
jgi:hypothetical protein